MITTKVISPDRQIKNLAIILAVLFLFQTLGDWELIKLMFADSNNWDFSSIIFFIPKLILPIGLWGLWNLKQYGWVLTTIIITILIASTFLTTLYEIKWLINDSGLHLNQATGGQLTINPIDNSLIDKIFGRRPFLFYLGQLIAIGTILFFINKRTVTDIFKISKKTQLTILGVTSVPVLLHGLILLF